MVLVFIHSDKIDNVGKSCDFYFYVVLVILNVYCICFGCPIGIACVINVITNFFVELACFLACPVFKYIAIR